MPDRRRAHARIAAVVVAALAALVFAGSLFGPFIYDDRPLIAGNAAVREPNLRAWLTRDFWDVSPELLNFTSRVRYWRPIVTASYALDWKVWSGRPLGFHVTNLVAHAVASVLAMFTLRRWTGAIVPATVGALFFAVHPTKAESVAWISGRTDVLCAIAIFVALAGVAMRMRGQRAGIAVEAIGTIAAYMTKEGALVLPALVTVEAWNAAGRPPLGLRLLRPALPQLAVAIGYLAVRTVVMPIRPTTPRPPPLDHLALVAETIGHYVLLAFAPHDLSMQRGLLRTEAGRLILSPSLIALGAFAIVAGVITIIALRKKRPAIALAIALCFGTLLPASNLSMTGLSTSVAERFLYVPILGIAYAVAELCRIGAARRFFLVVSGAAIAILGVIAAGRARDFADEVGFWAREEAIHPEALEPKRFAISRAIADRRHRDALKIAVDAQAVAARWYRDQGSELDFTIRIVEMRARLTPDLATAKLAAYERFFLRIAEATPGDVDLAVGGLKIDVRLDRILVERARRLRPHLQTLAGDLASRQGEDPRAIDLASQAHAACPSCIPSALTLAFASARAGAFDRAREVLAGARSGPATIDAARSIDQAAQMMAASAQAPPAESLQLRASAFTTLEAWGRAYEVLAPHRASIEAVPEAALGFAELAYRAGATDVAKEIVAKHVPEASRKDLFDTWARRMGWS